MAQLGRSYSWRYLPTSPRQHEKYKLGQRMHECKQYAHRKKKSVNKRTLTYNSYCTNHSPAVHGSSISYNMEQDGNVTRYKENELYRT